jgi:putative addiction module CopG family antidote
MATIHISLPDEMQEWVEHEVQAGGFATPSDYVQELLREAKVRQELETQLIAGLDSGEPQKATPQWWADLHLEIKGEQDAR